MTFLIFTIIIMAANGFICTLVDVTLMNLSEAYIREYALKNPEIALKLKNAHLEYEVNQAALAGINTLLVAFGSALTGVKIAEIYGTQAVLLASLLTAVAMVATTQVLPRAVANRFWQNLTVFSVKVLPLLRLMAAPFAGLAEIVRILGLNRYQKPVARSEIETVTEQGLKDGAIEDTEYQLLNNVLKFKQYRLKDIMVERSKLTALDPNQTIKSAHEKIQQCSNNKFPLFGQTHNESVGFVTRADITQAMLEGKENEHIRTLARAILTVPHDMRARKLLQKFRARQCEIALIVDDYGEVIGMVAQEDVLSTLLSNLQRSAA